MQPRVLLTRKWPENVEALMAGQFGAMLNPSDCPMQEPELAQAMRTFDVLCPTVSDRITAPMIDQPDRRTRLICNYGAGVDHIDLDACRRNGVIVTNTPDVLTDATAELAVLLMLMTARRAGEGERELRAGDWTGWRPTHLIGSGLSGRLLGLVGFGRIAQATARKSRGLGMQVAYYGRRRADPEIERETEARFEPDLGKLLAEADVVSLHVPGGPETANLIDATRLAQMKPSALLINTARGSVVDEAALVDALHRGRLGGAGLDVFQNEPLLFPDLLTAPRLVALPHLGSATSEARSAMGLRALDNLRAWIEGRAPPDRVRL